jgi:hypothetical protein
MKTWGWYQQFRYQTLSLGGFSNNNSNTVLWILQKELPDFPKLVNLLQIPKKYNHSHTKRNFQTMNHTLNVKNKKP